jgi:hypothetical protein
MPGQTIEDIGRAEAKFLDEQLHYGMGIARLTDLPAEWSKQREMLGFPSH